MIHQKIGMENSIENQVKALNLVVDILQKFVTKVFSKFCAMVNVEPDLAPRLMMKNEYLLSRMMLTNNKRQYAGRIICREGTILEKPKIDIRAYP